MPRRKTIDRPTTAARSLRDRDDLGRLFDAHAERLHRLAIHLVGDAAQAEDVVQETFLAVVESADRYDESRPIGPWLRGILVNQARRHRRRAARGGPPHGVLERAAAAPPQEVLDADQAGAVAEAIDRLREPYRQVVLLRVRHGMSAADIAHVLQRSPGTVRVQLHRGIATLRRAVPVAVALLGLGGTAAARGLDVVREAVLARASAESALAWGGSSVGGLLMAKNTVAWATAIAALIVLAVWQPWRARESGGSTEERQPVEALSANTEQDAEPALQPRRARATEPAADLPATPRHAFEGTVVHAETKAPLPDAAVAYFAAGETTLSEVKRSAWQTMEQQAGGGVRGLTSSPAILLRTLTAGERLGYLPVPVFRDPGDGGDALDTFTTRANGAFRLSTPAVAGVLRISKPGFGTRVLPAQGGARGVTVALRPMRLLRGRVLDAQGKPFTEPLDILFSGGDPGTVLAPEDGKRHTVPGTTVLVRTGSDGRFEIRIAAEWVFERCRTPGYRLQRRDPGDWRKPHRFSLGTAGAGETPQVATLVALPVPTLVLRDAVSRRPIEEFFLHGRDRTLGSLSWSGRFYAPGGRFTLMDQDGQFERARGKPITLHVWAEGYAPARVQVPDLTQEHWIELDLTPGEAPSLTGRISRRGEPVAGAETSLLTFRPIAWSEHDQDHVAWSRSNEEGRFALDVPRGRYVLRVRAGQDLYQRVVTVGEDDDLDVDLAGSAGIEVRVVDTAGRIQGDHSVGINGADGRSTRVYTDAAGLARFPLPPGKYKMFVPHVSTRGSFSADELQEVKVAEGAWESITFTVPDATTDVFVRLTCDTQVDFTTWRARQIAPHARERVALWSDGTIPLPVQAGVRQIDVELPDGRRFDLSLPTAPTETVERHIRLLGPRYEGTLLSEAGTPRAGVRVIATQLGGGGSARAKPSCVTDARGRFVLHCAKNVKHTLGFNKDAARVSWNHLAGGLDGQLYSPDRPPSDDPVALTIQLRSTRQGDRASGVRLYGVVRFEDPDGKPGGLGMSVVLLFPDEMGVMRVSPDGAFLSLDDKGGYEAFLPRAPKYRIYVYDRGTGKPVTQREWTFDAQEKESEQDLVVPKLP